jgi:hypothetical protein
LAKISVQLYLETIQKFFQKAYRIRRKELLELISDFIITVGKIITVTSQQSKAQKARLHNVLEKQ